MDTKKRLLDLPEELLLLIMSHLDALSTHYTALTCRPLWRISRDDSVWKKRAEMDYGFRITRKKGIFLIEDRGNSVRRSAHMIDWYRSFSAYKFFVLHFRRDEKSAELRGHHFALEAYSDCTYDSSQTYPLLMTFSLIFKGKPPKFGEKIYVVTNTIERTYHLRNSYSDMKDSIAHCITPAIAPYFRIEGVYSKKSQMMKCRALQEVAKSKNGMPSTCNIQIFTVSLSQS